jgi:zinc transport system ATP-binding protein
VTGAAAPQRGVGDRVQVPSTSRRRRSGGTAPRAALPCPEVEGVPVGLDGQTVTGLTVPVERFVPKIAERTDVIGVHERVGGVGARRRGVGLVARTGYWAGKRKTPPVVDHLSPATDREFAPGRFINEYPEDNNAFIGGVRREVVSGVADQRDTQASHGDAVVDLTDVTFGYGDTVAVEEVSLSVEAGEFLGILGPNGSGKTTLLHLMIGLKQPDAGTVSLFGEPTDAFVDGERIGYVAQRATDRGDAMPISVRETVLMGRFPHAGHGRIGSEDRAAVDRALDRVGIAALAELADRPIDQLSGGQRQRTFIARALAAEADLLALDEPTVGVDVDSRTAFYDMLDELNREGMTIVLIEHDVDILTTHVDTVACLNRRLYHHGDTTSFLESDAIEEAYGRRSGIVDHHA